MSLPPIGSRRATVTRLSVIVVAATVLVGCGGGTDPASTTPVPATASTDASTPEPMSTPGAAIEPISAEAPTPTEPAAVATAPVETTVAVAPAGTSVDGTTSSDATEPEPDGTTPATPSDRGPLGELDDLDEDSSRDETCGIADLGGGLTVATLCDTALVPTPEDGVTPTPASVLLLPSPSRWTDLDGVDATVRVARTVDGIQAVIYILGSDTLFDSGGDAVRPTAEPPLDAVAASILARFPAASVTVRGGADSVGSAAANLALSQRRAQAVADALAARGLGSVTSIGLGSAVPVAEEISPDGSVSEIGRQVNRRVEIAVVV